MLVFKFRGTKYLCALCHHLSLTLAIFPHNYPMFNILISEDSQTDVPSGSVFGQG